MGSDAYGINPQTIAEIVGEIKAVADLGVEIGVVIGGGNIFRGMAGTATGMDRATADYMGMLATVMNAMACPTPCARAGSTPGAVGAQHRAGGRTLHPGQGHPLSRRRQDCHLRGRHGQPVLYHRHRGGPARFGNRRRNRLKATKVDGIYSADPKRPQRHALRQDQLQRSDRQESRGHGCDRLRALPRPEIADQRFPSSRPAR